MDDVSTFHPTVEKLGWSFHDELLAPPGSEATVSTSGSYGNSPHHKQSRPSIGIFLPPVMASIKNEPFQETREHTSADRNHL